MRDVLGKMRECGKYVKMRDFPHDCGMVDTYALLNNNTTPNSNIKLTLTLSLTHNRTANIIPNSNHNPQANANY